MHRRPARGRLRGARCLWGAVRHRQPIVAKSLSHAPLKTLARERTWVSEEEGEVLGRTTAKLRLEAEMRTRRYRNRRFFRAYQSANGTPSLRILGCGPMQVNAEEEFTLRE